MCSLCWDVNEHCSCLLSTGSHQAYGASEHFILFQSVGGGKDGRWWIAAPVIFCIEKFSTFMWLLLCILFL